MLDQNYQHAVNYLKQGGIIAYPTEGVFGLGCDPYNQTAVLRLLELKKRSIEQGLILIADNWQTVSTLTLPIPQTQMQIVFSTWPGPVTWIFPASNQVPTWIRGKHSSIALRITAHSQAKTLCEQWGHPLVSTSANQHGKCALRDSDAVIKEFGNQIDFIFPGQVGNLTGPTEIRDCFTGKILRGQ